MRRFVVVLGSSLAAVVACGSPPRPPAPVAAAPASAPPPQPPAAPQASATPGATGSPRTRAGDQAAGAPDDGCDEAFPTRLWPVMAEASECSDGAGVMHPSTGPGSANWFHFGGCGGYVVFETSPGHEVRIKGSGDGCGCDGCVLWHVNYEIEEIGALGFYETKARVETPNEQCPGGKETLHFKTHRPSGRRFRLSASGGEGFYFTACAR